LKLLVISIFIDLIVLFAHIGNKIWIIPDGTLALLYCLVVVIVLTL